MARRFAGDRRWRGWALYSIASAILMMVFLAAFGVANGHGGLAGLFERLAVLVRSIWTLLFVARLLTGTRLSRQDEVSILGVLRKSMPWRNLYLGPIPQTDLFIGFQQMDNAQYLEDMKGYMVPNASSNGILVLTRDSRKVYSTNELLTNNYFCKEKDHDYK